MQLTLATLENRPTHQELWIYDNSVVVNGALQLEEGQNVRRVKIDAFTLDNISAVVSIQDWNAGKAVCVTLRDFQAGDLDELSSMMDINPEQPELGQELKKNGYIRVYLSSTDYVTFSPGECTGEVPNISVAQEIIDSMDQSKATIKVQSIVNGELTTWQ